MTFATRMLKFEVKSLVPATVLGSTDERSEVTNPFACGSASLQIDRYGFLYELRDHIATVPGSTYESLSFKPIRTAVPMLPRWKTICEQCEYIELTLTQHAHNSCIN